MKLFYWLTVELLFISQTMVQHVGEHSLHSFEQRLLLVNYLYFEQKNGRHMKNHLLMYRIPKVFGHPLGVTCCGSGARHADTRIDHEAWYPDENIQCEREI